MLLFVLFSVLKDNINNKDDMMFIIIKVVSFFV